MWTTRHGRLVLGLAFVAAGSWWLLPTPVEEPVTRMRPRMPNHIVSQFSAVETDVQGRPERRLTATQLRQYPAEDLTELDRPNLLMFQQDGGPPWDIRAERGVILTGGEELRLLDGVRIDRASGPENRSVRLATEALRIWPEREYAEGDQPVRLESEGDWLTAAGIRVWYSRPARAEYPGRVHIFVAPTNQ